MATQLTISVQIAADIQKVWDAYTKPEHIIKWNFASDDWQCPRAENDLRVGGKYLARMEAKDGSFGFDFEAEYTELVPGKRLSYMLGDNRKVTSTFEMHDGITVVKTVFDAEMENSIELQQNGWQAILNNFKLHTESI